MFKLSFVVFVSAYALAYCTPTFSIYETAKSIEYHGYPVETHHVTTSDGYILEMHRIPHGKNQVYSSDQPVVFLMHGLLAASNSYLILGSEYAPAYNLADAGFDVWMGNARGNKNSRYHVTLNPDDGREKLDFFDFSWEEIGTYDLPAMIDYTLASTNRDKLHYIGHSQGGTVFLVLNSMRPEYNDKFESVHLWAGVGYMHNFPHPDLSLAAQFTDTIYNMAVLGGMVELFPPENNTESSRQASDCVGNDSQIYLCQLIGVNTLMGNNTTRDEEGSVFDNYDPAGAALKQIAHYGQNIRDKTFARWSYSFIQNLAVYGSRNPPEYDLGLITAKVTMHYTVSDTLLDERDVLAMASDMPNCEVRKVARDTFLHEDFVASPDAKELVTDYVIEAIKMTQGPVLQPVLSSSTAPLNTLSMPSLGFSLLLSIYTILGYLHPSVHGP